MNRQGYRFAIVVVAVLCVIGLPSCGHDQQLVSIDLQPGVENFGATNIPVSDDAGLNVQIKAMGNYIHPPVTKDITDQAVWASNTPQMVTVTSAGLITATGNFCGSTLITATVTTNKSAGGISSSRAEVVGRMTANVICFTGIAGPLLTVSVSGTGTVSSNPVGISCPSTCNANFASGTPITLTATLAGSATSVSWSGCAPSGLVCNINSLTANTVVTATFQ
jgi:hypothetical protein